jgi:hypothetical protein
MTQDEIIEMARQCGFEKFSHDDCDLICYPEEIEAFANLVAEHERERIKAANAPEIERINAHIKELEDAVLAEREACAKVCEEYADDSRTGATCAEVIRARGQA